jgi:hypothetical protein
VCLGLTMESNRYGRGCVPCKHAGQFTRTNQCLPPPPSSSPNYTAAYCCEGVGQHARTHRWLSPQLPLHLPLTLPLDPAPTLTLTLTLTLPGGECRTGRGQSACEPDW